MEVDYQDLKVGFWWINQFGNCENGHEIALEELKKQDYDVVAVMRITNRNKCKADLQDFVDATGYEYYYINEYAAYGDSDLYAANVIFSKYPLSEGEIVWTKTEDTTVPENSGVQGVMLAHCTVTVRGNEIDLFMGHDVSPAEIESYVKANTGEGNDFIIFGHNMSTMPESVAGKSVDSLKSGNYGLISSLNTIKVDDKSISTKPSGWGNAAAVSDLLTMNLKVAVEEETPVETEVSLLQWWINNPKTADLEKIKAEVLARDADIAALISITKTSAPDLDMEAFAKEMGYPYYQYVKVADNGRGNILLSKYPFTHVKDITNGAYTLNYFLIDVNGKKLDVYTGYDCVPADFEADVKAVADESGNDFVLMTHRAGRLASASTYAGKKIAAIALTGGQSGMAVSLDKCELVGTLTATKVTETYGSAGILTEMAEGTIILK